MLKMYTMAILLKSKHETIEPLNHFNNRIAYSESVKTRLFQFVNTTNIICICFIYTFELIETLWESQASRPMSTRMTNRYVTQYLSSMYVY